jgi:hypothetical protein
MLLYQTFCTHKGFQIFRSLAYINESNTKHLQSVVLCYHYKVLLHVSALRGPTSWRKQMQEMCAYLLIYKHLCLLYMNLFPTNCAVYSFDAPPCVGQEPRTSSESYSTWEHMQLLIQLVSREWWIVYVW